MFISNLSIQQRYLNIDGLDSHDNLHNLQTHRLLPWDYKICSDPPDKFRSRSSSNPAPSWRPPDSVGREKLKKVRLMGECDPLERPCIAHRSVLLQPQSRCGECCGPCSRKGDRSRSGWFYYSLGRSNGMWRFDLEYSELNFYSSLLLLLLLTHLVMLV